MIKAIETLYRGYKFRSRTEARYAVFFNVLGVRWEYEKEGYNLPSGFYLPDFWLPDHKCWLEIKGQEPTLMERELAIQLRDATTFPVTVFIGAPEIGKYGYCYATDLTDSSGGSSEWEYTTWAICKVCGKPGLTWGDLRHDIYTTLFECVGWCRCGWREDTPPGSWTWDEKHIRIKAAVLAAKQARFEHGESGI